MTEEENLQELKTTVSEVLDRVSVSIDLSLLLKLVEKLEKVKYELVSISVEEIVEKEHITTILVNVRKVHFVISI